MNSNTTRGHSLKLAKNRSRLDIRKYFFTNRVVEVWNNLSDTIVTAPNVKTFERRLDKYWSEHPMIYDFNTDYNTMTGSSTKDLSSDDDTEPNKEEQAVLLRLEQH